MRSPKGHKEPRHETVFLPSEASVPAPLANPQPTINNVYKGPTMCYKGPTMRQTLLWALGLQQSHRA